MNRLLFFFTLVCTLFIFTSCSDDDSNTIPEQEPVRYYVKYEMTSKTYHDNQPRIITVNTEKGIQTITLKDTWKNTSWEETYGPVNKSFIPSLEVNIKKDDYSSTIQGKIYVSREKEPFVLKAQGSSGTYSLSLTCSIDF